MNLESFVNQKFDSLNVTDREIAQFFVQNKEFVEHASIAEVAEKSLFSKSSIFRCCKRLGLSGFSQLHYILEDEALDDNNINLNVDYLSETLKSVLWTVNQFKRTKLDDIYECLSKANQLYIYATGWEQQIVAQQMQRNLYLMGHTAFVFPSAAGEMDAAESNIEKGDVLITISHTGMNPTILKMMAALKLRGVKIVSFTSFRENRLAQLADYNLYYDTITKLIPEINHKELFFSNLHLLIDIFCMAYANYLAPAHPMTERGLSDDDHDDEK